MSCWWPPGSRKHVDMESAFRGKRRGRRLTINITSLIDVMFLLLIFFMITATFRERLGIDITLPKAKTATEQEAAPYEITVSQAGELFFDRKPVDETSLRRAMSDALESNRDATFVLKADEKADFGVVLRAIDLARELGGTRLIIPARRESLP